MYGEGAMTASNVSKVVLKFHVGDFLLDNPPLYGRPVKVYMDQMEILTENSQYYTTQEIASTLKISKLSTKNNL